MTGEILMLMLGCAVGYVAGARMSRKRHYRECALILEHRAALLDDNYKAAIMAHAAAAIREAANG